MALTLTSEYSISYLSPGESGWPDAVRKDKLIVCQDALLLWYVCVRCPHNIFAEFVSVYAFRGRLSNSGILTN